MNNATKQAGNGQVLYDVGFSCNVTFYNIIAMVVGSLLTQVTREEAEARESLFVIPDSEKDPQEIRKTLRYSRISVLVGIIVMLVLLVLWVLPYLQGLRLA